MVVSKGRVLTKSAKRLASLRQISWNELSSMTRQSLQGHRFATIEAIDVQISAWARSINTKQRGVEW